MLVWHTHTLPLSPIHQSSTCSIFIKTKRTSNVWSLHFSRERKKLHFQSQEFNVLLANRLNYSTSRPRYCSYTPTCWLQAYQKSFELIRCTVLGYANTLHEPIMLSKWMNSMAILDEIDTTHVQLKYKMKQIKHMLHANYDLQMLPESKPSALNYWKVFMLTTPKVC